MSNAGDWFKLYRELYDKPIWLNSTPEQKCVLMALLGMMSWEENSWEWKGEKFTVQPGQRITSLESIAQRCGKGISIQNVRTALLRFEKLGFLTNESTKTGRLISIINWERYQGGSCKPNKASNIDLTKTSQRPNKDLTPIKNNKNVRSNKRVSNDTLSCHEGDTAGVSTCPHSEIINLYHEILPELAKVQIWNSRRQGLLRSRWSENPERQNLEWWKRFFLMVKASDFLTGKVKEFRATLEWLVSPKNFPKVLEGNYHNGGKPQNKSTWQDRLLASAEQEDSDDGITIPGIH